MCKTKVANCWGPALQERMKDMVYLGPDLLRSRTLCVHNWFCVLLVCVWWVICQYRDCTGKRKWLQKWWRRPYLNEGFMRVHSFCHTGYGRAEWLQVRNDCSPASATKGSTVSQEVRAVVFDEHVQSGHSSYIHCHQCCLCTDDVYVCCVWQQCRSDFMRK